MPARKSQSYPYRISPIPLRKVPRKTGVKKALAATDLHPRQIEEFFRIEALLRSKKMMALHRRHKAEACQEVEAYKRKKTRGGVSVIMRNCLWEKFGIPYGWTILAGAHHHLILKPWLIIPSGITYLREFKPILRDEDPRQWIEDVLDQPDRFLPLTLDLLRPVKTLLGRLRPILVKRHLEMKKARQFDVEVWKNYFQAYDFRMSKGWPYSRIAQKLYSGEESGASTVAKAVKAVRELIAQAEGATGN